MTILGLVQVKLGPRVKITFAVHDMDGILGASMQAPCNLSNMQPGTWHLKMTI